MLPTPYYEEPGITIYCADCRDVLPHLSRAALVLTDPPFFMPATHYQSRVGWQRKWGDTSILATFWSVMSESLVRLVKPTGHFLVFCNHESYPVFYAEMYGRCGFLKSLVWDKGHVGLGRVWRNQHELIIAARWDAAVFHDEATLRSDVLRYSATRTSDRQHPVEKPIELLADLIIPTTALNDIVVDPFMGSGTTLLAAKALGRRAIGIEIEEEYCAIAVERLRQEVLPFVAPESEPVPEQLILS
jgi:site-specific DNA-methyltransferase (adenine-specific)